MTFLCLLAFFQRKKREKKKKNLNWKSRFFLDIYFYVQYEYHYIDKGTMEEFMVGWKLFYLLSHLVFFSDHNEGYLS